MGNIQNFIPGPHNFLLYADMTTINMVSLDPDTDVRPVVLHHGDISSNYVALTFDDAKDRIYWSDHTRYFFLIDDEFNRPKKSDIILFVFLF